MDLDSGYLENKNNFNNTYEEEMDTESSKPRVSKTSFKGKAVRRHKVLSKTSLRPARGSKKANKSKGKQQKSKQCCKSCHDGGDCLGNSFIGKDTNNNFSQEHEPTNNQTNIDQDSTDSESENLPEEERVPCR